MTRFLYEAKQLSEKDGAQTPLSLEYYILESQTRNENINISIFGMEIVKTQCVNGIEYTEAKAIREICATEKLIFEVARILSENTVTPICLEEVLNDIIAMAACTVSEEKTTA